MHGCVDPTSPPTANSCDACDSRAVCAAPTSHAKRILVVEDDTSARQLLLRVLKLAGHEVFGAGAAEEATAHVAEVSVDLIILDHGLSDTDGITFLTSERPSCCADIPVIMITSSDNHKLVIQAFRDGVADFLVKPLDQDILLLVINRTLERARVRRELEQEHIARQSAEAISRAKSAFLANIGHGLRTAMHHLGSFPELLQKAITEKRYESVNGFLTRIIEAANRLTVLINDLTDLGETVRGELECQHVDYEILPTVDAVISDVRDTLRGKGCTIDLATDLPEGFSLYGDQQRIQRVLRHLVDNAVSFAYPETQLDIKLSQDAVGDLRFVIENIGPLIPDDELAAVFEPFTQSSVTDNGAGRSGMGLSFAKNIITAHGGKIWLETDPAGSIVRCIFTLPIRQTAEE